MKFIKIKNRLVQIVFFGIIIFQGCKDLERNIVNEKRLSSRDSAFLVGWNKYFAKENNYIDTKFDMPVDRNIAENCVDTLKDVMSGGNLGRIIKAYTESVWSGSPELQRWIVDNDIFGKSDSIAFRLGMYTTEAYSKHGTSGMKPGHVRRITIFIWPYAKGKSGEPVTVSDPFNTGSLHP